MNKMKKSVLSPGVAAIALLASAALFTQSKISAAEVIGLTVPGMPQASHGIDLEG